MPELPEVETTKRSLEPLLDKKITHISVFHSQLRWQIPSDLSVLVGYTLSKVTRRAKYLILHFTKDTVVKKLIIHLGMSGSLQQRFIIDSDKQEPSHLVRKLDNITVEKHKHDHVIMTFDNTNVSLNYHDPRRFGAVLWHDDYEEKLFGHLAPEPLSDLFDADYLYQRLKNTKRAIKTSIMDQACVVGVGNIYATESLFLSGIHPLYPSNELKKSELVLLVEHIKTILKKAIVQGGSTLNDFSYSQGQTGYFQQILFVYGRAGETCTTCTNILENIKITGRASVFCSTCQKLPQQKRKKKK